MKVLHRQQLGLALLDPRGTSPALTLGAVTIAAGVIADAEMVALIALFNMAAACGSAAGLDGLHDFELMQGQRMPLAVSGAVLSKNVGQLECGPAHGD
jgi:hypothetical protein